MTSSSFFAPAADRASSIVVLRHEKWQQYRIVTTLCTRSTTEVFEVDATRGSGGALLLAKDHVFQDEASALERQYQNGFVVVARGSGLLGYVAASARAGLLLATKVVPTALLPGGHTILLVQEARWIFFGLDGLMSFEEERFWGLIQQQNLSGTHYYCETADITRPFPSSFSPSEPQREFVWNSWMSQPFASLGMTSHCPALIQGAAHSVDEISASGQRYAFCLISRRSRRHPGTRYNARGLNDLAGPGNEIEAELLMWTISSFSERVSFAANFAKQHQASHGTLKQFDFENAHDLQSEQKISFERGENIPIKKNNSTSTSGFASSVENVSDSVSESPGQTRKGHRILKWARVVWRRGTVPIRWGVEIQPLNKGLQAEVYVREKGTYHGTLTYFRSLQEQALNDAHASIAACRITSKPHATENYENWKDDVDISGNLSNCSQRSGGVICVNLLHCNPKKAAELMLSSHFQESMLHVRSHLKSRGRHHLGESSSSDKYSIIEHKYSMEAPAPRLINFDWHGTMGKLTEERGIEAFWTFIEQPIKETSFAIGEMLPASCGKDADNLLPTKDIEPTCKDKNVAEDITPWGRNWQMKWLQRQKGILRFNCADSLDRTNAASCFAFLPVLHEGLRTLGVRLDIKLHSDSIFSSFDSLKLSDSISSFNDPEGDSGANRGSIPGTTVEVLPDGWERTEYNGRALYVDHNLKKTQWDPPKDVRYHIKRSSSAGVVQSCVCDNKHESDDQDWKLFSFTLNDVRNRLYPDAVADYVSLFKRHGDVHSELYTGSPAMHSHVLSLILHSEARPYGGASTGVGRLQNLRVAVQRRWNNAVSDDARQASIEVFLGRRIHENCPGVIISFNPELNDLEGPDPDDVDEALEQQEKLQQPMDLGYRGLHVMKHDGRVGLTDDLINLDSIESNNENEDNVLDMNEGESHVMNGDRENFETGLTSSTFLDEPVETNKDLNNKFIDPLGALDNNEDSDV